VFRKVDTFWTYQRVAGAAGCKDVNTPTELVKMATYGEEAGTLEPLREP
jgi:hypothetical protein